jgi:hypothetical protein
MMPSREPQFAQKKPDDSRRLENKEVIAYKITGMQQKAQGGFKELTLQLIACRLDNFNKKRIALFKVNDLGHQIRHMLH